MPAPQFRGKSVMDLAIVSCIDNKDGVLPGKLDPTFLRMATYQMRLFLFPGSYTTSSFIAFTYYLLFQNPHALSQLRNEHDEVFGKDVTAAAHQLKCDPSLLSRCKMTQAVIKETLRLYSPAATMRTESSTCFLSTNRGVSLPTNNSAILVSHHAIHRNARLWPRASEFLPERWLVGPQHELHPKNGTWRPFELGPRGCIGQTLALNEIKIALILPVRHFDFTPAYEEFDNIQKQKLGFLRSLSHSIGLAGNDAKEWRGDRAYQTEKAGAHPSFGYPCYVSTRREDTI